MTKLATALTYTPVELSFGTSGLRGLVSDMTDLECYINTRGFLDFITQSYSDGLVKKVCLAGDLRDSTPRILRTVHQAVLDSGFETIYCGLVPTPALVYYAFEHGMPSIMVTGSHIPDNRNGIKFQKPDNEVLKTDEQLINAAVTEVRSSIYSAKAEQSAFDAKGQLIRLPNLPLETAAAVEAYRHRCLRVFDNTTLRGKEVVLYQHSAVGRDIILDVLADLGAKVTPVGRSDKFIPIDSENVTPKHQEYFRSVAKEHPDAFAIVSTDGDSDRPFVIDENGIFHRGDNLGALVAEWLGADFAAVPISSSNAVDEHLSEKNIQLKHTKIGSPYVISAMESGVAAGCKKVVGWEVNGGFLLGSNIKCGNDTLKALPTRDAFLPIVIALFMALERGQTVSELFGSLPQRFTQAGLIDDFPVEVSKAIIHRFSVGSPEVRLELGQYFTKDLGFGSVTSSDSLDGVRIYFDNGDIAHMRPSSNAPQMRLYSVADTQKRADEIVNQAITEPDGIFRQLEAKYAVPAEQKQGIA